MKHHIRFEIQKYARILISSNRLGLEEEKLSFSNSALQLRQINVSRTSRISVFVAYFGRTVQNYLKLAMLRVYGYPRFICLFLLLFMHAFFSWPSVLSREEWCSHKYGNSPIQTKAVTTLNAAVFSRASSIAAFGYCIACRGL